MDKVLFASLLFDFYSSLLTDKQKKVYELYHLDDLSMQEIGEIFQVSRQSVNDLLKRTEKILNNYEKKLLLVSKHLQRESEMAKIKAYVSKKDIDYISLENKLYKLLDID